jgi:hypothetical protein
MTEPCSGYRERLYLYFDGEIEALEAREIEFHLAGCDRCRIALEEIRSIERHLRAGLTEYIETARPGDRAWDDIDPMITRLLNEPQPRWSATATDRSANSARHRNFGWGTLLVIGVAGTLAVLRIGITTAPSRSHPGLRPLTTAVSNVSYGSIQAATRSREDIEKETDALLTGLVAVGDSERIERARRLRALGAIWEARARSNGSSADYRKALEAYLGAMSLGPGSPTINDSGRAREVGRQAGAAIPIGQ